MIRFNDILDKVTPFYTEREITQLQKAYVFAARAHKGQVRRSAKCEIEADHVPHRSQRDDPGDPVF